MLAWLVPAGVILASCGWLGLIEPTETRYAEIAREMLASRDWLIPHLNGIPHFDKPPLAYWCSAVGMAILGVNEWGARVFAALAAGFTLWFTAKIARHEGREGPAFTGADAAAVAATVDDSARARATLAPLILASTFLFFAISHQLAADIFLTAVVAGFYAAVLDPRARRTLWPFVALGLGFLTKGPVVFITTLLPVLLAAAWARDGALVRWLGNLWGWLVFAVIALPWYLAVVVATRGLLPYFLHHQLWERYATMTHHRPGPIYYFLVVILVGTLPWTWAAFREWSRAAWGGARRAASDALLASWILLPLVFFSFSGSKLPAYILPLYPGLAVLASRWPSPARAGRWLKVAGITFAILVAALAAVTPFDDRLGSPKAIAQKLKDSRRAGEPVVEYGTFNAGVPFYLRETVPMLDVTRDLEFEAPAARAGTILSRDEFRRMVQVRGSGWVVGNQAATEELAKALGLKVSLVAGSGNQSLLLLQRS